MVHENDTRDALLAAQMRNSDALHILAAVSGIPRHRLAQIAAGEGEEPTLMERTTINMLKGA